MKQRIRTDLAAERFQSIKQSTNRGREVEGVSYHRKTIHSFPVEEMEIQTPSASKLLCKPCGFYYTIALNKICKRCDHAFIDGVQCIAQILQNHLPKGNRYLIACLGNPSITPDAIGPLCAKQIMVTRHLKSYMPEMFSDFAEVSLVSPGVLGTTGIESASLVKGAVDAVHPDAVIVIDAMAAADVANLCKTIQITDTGIEPGSGVGNRRYALNQKTLGVPVLSMGVPTIVDMSTLLYSIGNTDSVDREMMVTPQNIDSLVSDSAKLLAYGINFALHPSLTLEDVDLFIS